MHFANIQLPHRKISRTLHVVTIYTFTWTGTFFNLEFLTKFNECYSLSSRSVAKWGKLTDFETFKVTPIGVRLRSGWVTEISDCVCKEGG